MVGIRPFALRTPGLCYGRVVAKRQRLIFLSCQYPARQRNGNRTSTAQRGGIEVRRNCCGIGEGPPDPPEQIDNQTRCDGELTIGEMLDENGAEEGVVGGLDCYRRGYAQARAQIP